MCVGLRRTRSLGHKDVIISFEVPGAAAGKARPRVTRSGQHTYTPDPGGYVKRVTAAGVEARNASDWPGIVPTVGISMKVIVTKGMPKSWSKRKRAELDGGWAPHTPDTGNIALACCDALSGVLYEDDRQVVELYSSQRWGLGHNTEITLELLT
jgi:Holliday junction resolvase RusA-like endonuclease